MAAEHSCAWCAFMYGGNGNFCDYRGKALADAQTVRPNTCPHFELDREHAAFSNERLLALGADGAQLSFAFAC